MRNKFFFFTFLIISNLFSQKKMNLIIGITHSSGYIEQDLGLNIGIEYKKWYSQISILKGLRISTPEFFGGAEIIGNKNLGFGATQRYFPNKQHSFFTSFLETGVAVISFNAQEYFGTYDTLTKLYYHTQIKRKVFRGYIGYGIGINFLHFFTITHNIGAGYYFVNGQDIFPLGTSPTGRIKDNDLELRFNLSLLFHFKGF